VAVPKRISCNSPELNELDDQMQNMQRPEPRHCNSMPVRGNFRGPSRRNRTLRSTSGDSAIKQGGFKMRRRLIWVTLLSVATVVATLYRTPKTHAMPVQNDHHVCSVASLKGTYAFSRTGVNNVVGGPIAEIGLDVINGDGTRGIIRSARSSNGVIQDWTNFPPNTGTYTVDPDCTGSFFDANGNKNDIIVLDGGKRFLLLSVAPETTVTSEGTRIEPED
jgi:hypothetical protein